MAGALAAPSRRRAALAALAALPWAFLAVPASPPARAAPRFDESRSFDRDYAMRFVAVPSITRTLVEAMFLQLRPPKGTREALAGKDGDVVRDEVCGCLFDREGKLTDPTHCEAMRGVDDELSARVGSFSVVDPSTYARRLACYGEGSRACIDQGGSVKGGVSCCRQVDDGFVGATHDPHFWVLAPLTLTRRLNGLVPGRAASGSPKMCGIAIDAAAGVYSLPPSLDGIVARGILYAVHRYGAVPPVAASDLASISRRAPATMFEVARERLVRSRYSAPDHTMDGALKAVPPTRAFKGVGIRE